MIEIRAEVAVVLLLGFIGSIYVFFRMIVSQFERRLTERFDARDKILAAETKAFQDLRQEVARIRHSLPIEYVRQEDWIRFTITIGAKLDTAIEFIRQSVPGGTKP